MLCECDSCKTVFVLDGPDSIRVQAITIDGVGYVVDFVMCPSCKHVDLVSVKDARYYRLAKQLEKARKRISKLKAMGVHERTYTNAVRSAYKKQERLGKHTDNLLREFRGTFTVESIYSNGKQADVLVYHGTIQ